MLDLSRHLSNSRGTRLGRGRQRVAHRHLAETPEGQGLAGPGMPVAAPGMEVESGAVEV
jgi:hypothetical protein